MSINTAYGDGALNNNTGDSNTGVGYGALEGYGSNNSGDNNTALGNYALAHNTTGINNTAVGSNALVTNTSGSYNVALGAGSLPANVSGYENIACGTNALELNTSGYKNTAVGIRALYNNTTGYYNTGVGNGADVGIGCCLQNATAIGYNAIVQYDNTVQLGNNSLKQVITNGTLGIGSYGSDPPTTDKPFGSLYYNTVGQDIRYLDNNKQWVIIGRADTGFTGVTALSYTGLTFGATLTSDNYLQMAYAIGGNTSTTYPGLMPGSYSDIFSTQTIDLANFGQNWVQNTTLSTSTPWNKVAISASGQYQSVCVNNGSIWYSSDYGNNWTETTTSSGWTSISISASGQYQVACSNALGSQIYISSDFGSSWIPVTGTSDKIWFSVSISASGQYQTACVNSGGSIYISSNYGNKWTEITSTSGKNWYSVSISASGQCQTACVSVDGSIWISSDYGNNWTEITATSGNNWASISISASGQYQTACVGGGSIWISSDYGNNWTEITSISGSQSVSISASGQYQMVIETSSIFSSSDYGNNWTQVTISGMTTYRSCAMSASGQYQTITLDINSPAPLSYIYTCQNSISAGSEIAGVTAVGPFGLTGGATLTSDNYLQMGYAIGGGTANTYPGLMPESYSDIFSTQTIDLANFGQNWVRNTSAGSRQWSCIAVSKSGKYQTAGIYGGLIWISSNYGSTWRQVASTQNWSGVSISASGKYQVACSNEPSDSQIYISSNFGSNWSPVTGTSSVGWSSVSISASGQYQTACVDSGSIWISSNYGSTWTEVTGTASDSWYSVSISASGQYQTACVDSSGSIWISSNYGNNWTEITTTSGYFWYSVSISASGQYQTACVTNGSIWISSDYGNNWSPVSDDNQWSSVSVSASGQYQTACSGVGSIYVSSNYGSTWTAVSGISFNWQGISISSSGQYITAVIYNSTSNGYIYTCQNSISNGVVSVGNYSSTSGVTGLAGSIYYDTTSSVLKYSNGSTWSSIGSGSEIAGVTAVGSFGLTGGATLTSDNYLQMGYAIGGGTANTYPGLMPGSYSDIFSTQTIDLANFGKNWVPNTSTNLASSQNRWISISISASGQYQTACSNYFDSSSSGNLKISSDYGQTWSNPSAPPSVESGFLSYQQVCVSATGQYQIVHFIVSTTLYIYKSSNFGSTWSPVTFLNYSNARQIRIAISASGQYQFILYARLGNSEEVINVSSDYGTFWTSYTVSNISFSFISLSVSASGQYLTFCTNSSSDNFVYTSSNYGKSFVQNTTITSNSGFRGMAMSASGQYQTLGSNDLNLLYISTDYGQTWKTPTTAPTNTSNAISISASGQYQVLGSSVTNLIYYSSNYGNNWNVISVSNLRFCYEVSISASGQYISATGDNRLREISYIFTCQNSISNGVVSVGNYSTTYAPSYGITGSLYYNSTYAGASGLQVSTGSTWESVKSFVIDHPDDSEKYLVHGCLEGPEAGVYYRGRAEITNDEFVDIELPKYVKNLAVDLTFQITPIYEGKKITTILSATEVKDNAFRVYGDNCKFHWTVFGQRAPVNVEVDKNRVSVRGDGPYRWI